MTLNDTFHCFLDKIKSTKLEYWLISFFLIIPPAVLYLAHYLVKSDGLIPTGFIMDDMFYYMANAREHFDNGSFQLTYGNPFSPFYDTPSIYFQPMTLLLGIFWKITQYDPGIIFVFFGFFSVIVCSRIGIELYRQVVGLKYWPQKLGLILFFYGGGLLALSGILIPNGRGLTLFNIFRFDPSGGLWFLNFGRILILPTESFYHALFLGSVLCIIKKNYFCSLIICLILSMSHPFSGIELILILLAWSFLEIFFFQGMEIPKYFLAICTVILFYHVGYYLGFLNLFVEHRQLLSQWRLPWLLKAETIIPAYCLVGFMTFWQVRNPKLAATFFLNGKNRLFMIWFLVAFLLANHDFFINPIQPIHFTRGYVWIPLFFMGAKTIFDLFLKIKKTMNKFLSIVCIVILSSVFLSDNALWIGYRLAYSLQHKKNFGVYLNKSQKQILDWLNKNDITKKIVISQDLRLAYYITCYTPLRTWYSHWYNTPFAQKRKNELAAFFGKGYFLKIWRSMDILLIYSRDTAEWSMKNQPSWIGNISGMISYINSDYVVISLQTYSEGYL